jgi:hypothetical protein
MQASRDARIDRPKSADVRRRSRTRALVGPRIARHRIQSKSPNRVANDHVRARGVFNPSMAGPLQNP